jgi:hypothetical protein
MTERIAITYCRPCEIIYNTTQPMLVCGICRGQTKRVGWIEQIGEDNG